jgi:hypothetical protein
MGAAWAAPSRPWQGSWRYGGAKAPPGAPLGPFSRESPPRLFPSGGPQGRFPWGAPGPLNLPRPPARKPGWAPHPCPATQTPAVLAPPPPRPLPRGLRGNSGGMRGEPGKRTRVERGRGRQGERGRRTRGMRGETQGKAGERQEKAGGRRGECVKVPPGGLSGGNLFYFALSAFAP